MSKSIMISIVCITYNHAKYCSQAFDGFLSQKTDYAYEIIVHDDASTDGTQEIIKSYEKKYPSLFRVILESSNQYKQGISPLELAINHARGKYIAICEGDDYWIDQSKLQLQIEYLESHPECTFCFTNAVTYDQCSGKFGNLMLPKDAKERRILNHEAISISEILSIDFPPTASFVFRRDDYKRRPIFSESAYNGDRYYQIVMTSFGYAHYFDRVCSVYRTNNPSSVMGTWNQDISKWIDISRSLIALYDEFNEYTHFKYSSIINPIRDRREYEILWLSGERRLIRKMKYFHAASNSGIQELVKYLCKTLIPYRNN